MQKQEAYSIVRETEIANLEIDTLKGLSSSPKYLLSKYFYDDAGSSIFQEITGMPEYYLTRSEKEIFDDQKTQIAEAITAGISRFDLLELGSGDGSKTKILLNHLVHNKTDFTYIPVDISPKANNDLVKSLESDIPGLDVRPLTGDFFTLTNNRSYETDRSRVILFLGSNIGNFTEPELDIFLTRLNELCRSGDKVLIGFDLKKSPEVIMNAYDDPHGITRRFNMNYLTRLNRELDADFDPDMFEHHAVYNPVNGYLKSYLVSKEQQTVRIKSLGKNITFDLWEPVFMELSRKFDLHSVEAMAESHGFSLVRHFMDKKRWFSDSLLIRT